MYGLQAGILLEKGRAKSQKIENSLNHLSEPDCENGI
jgi:hypothetical protein